MEVNPNFDNTVLTQGKANNIFHMDSPNVIKEWINEIDEEEEKQRMTPAFN